jgi:hypothetical protein
VFRLPASCHTAPGSPPFNPDDVLLRIQDPPFNPDDVLLRIKDPNRVQHGENLGRKPSALQCDRRIEVNVGREVVLDEVIIGERDALELKCHLNDRVVEVVVT